MTTTTVIGRELIDQIVSRVIASGGEVYAEDVADVMSGLNLKSTLYAKVASTLEDICKATISANAFSKDLRKAWGKAFPDMPFESVSAEYAEQCYRRDAQTGVNLLIGLAALS